jgi:LysM repeat protein
MAILMTAKEFIEKVKEVQKTNTVYMWGTYGQVLTNHLIDYKANQYPSKNTPARVARHKKLVGQGYSAWDCVGLIKGILWGWTQGKSPPYGANGVPDTGSDGMFNNYCTNRSTDFRKIIPGCAVWIKGHIGVYIGGGLVIEATSRSTDGFTDNVLISALGNIGKVKGYPTRSWTHHGRLPWVDYAGQTEPKPEPKPPAEDVITYTVVKGDTLWGISAKYLGAGNKYKEIMSWNNLKTDVIKVGQKLKLYLGTDPPCDDPAEPTPEYFEYTVKKGDTPWELAKKYLGAGNRYPEIMKLSGLKNDATIYVGQVLKIPGKGIVVTPPKPPAFQSYKVRVNTRNGLNVRASASLSSRVVKVLGNGTVTTISKEQKQGARTWGYTAGHKGWIALDFTVRA